MLLVLMMSLFAASFSLGRSRSFLLARQVGGSRYLNSLPYYHGMLTALWATIPAIVVLVLWLVFEGRIVEWLMAGSLPQGSGDDPDMRGLVLNQIHNVANGQLPREGLPSYVLAAVDRYQALNRASIWLLAVVVMLIMAVFSALSWWRLKPATTARDQVEKTFQLMLFGSALIAIFTTVGIVASVLVESLRFFREVPVQEFLFGLEWSPQSVAHGDQLAGSNSFGVVPLLVGTMLVAAVALLVAVPTGLMSAIYLSEYAPTALRSTVKPLLEVLAGVPTVVYGFFAAVVVAPFIRDAAMAVGLHHHLTVSAESAVAAGLVMGVMIIPLVSSLSDDAINAVPRSLRDGALGLGATQSEMIRRVVIPAALPGIVGGVLLAVSRAIGETMIVVMAAGLVAKITANPFDSVTTITAQIVSLLVGEQSFDSPKTLAAFALGLLLFIITLALNYAALHVVKRYREQYE